MLYSLLFFLIVVLFVSSFYIYLKVANELFYRAALNLRIYGENQQFLKKFFDKKAVSFSKDLPKLQPRVVI